MKVELRKQRFDAWQEIERHQTQMQKDGQFGAVASFIGNMRDSNEGDNVSAMALEHYPGMTEQHLEKICKQAEEKWDLIDVLVIHRVGDIEIGEAIVLVAIWSAHRAAAFEACRFIMEDLKSRAPFWKQETLDEGKRWVEKNTPGRS
jgi:molybdopterin synthase catalytic subunit